MSLLCGTARRLIFKLLLLLCAAFQLGESRNAAHREAQGQTSWALTDHVLAYEFRLLERNALEHLADVLKTHEGGKPYDQEESVFHDLLIALPLHELLLQKTYEKTIVAPKSLQHMGSKTIVYAAGIAYQSSFEQHLSKLGNSVFAFDCSMPATASIPGVVFNNWCIGTPQGFENNVYTKDLHGNFTFYSLTEIKKKLGHTHIDILKMDIEGFEWEVLQKNILQNPNDEDLPTQLLFELHTEGANPEYVPQKVISGKTRHDVNTLVYALSQRGYRLVDLVVNVGDRYCADMTFFRVRGRGKSSSGST